jgi:squalene-hopene/tetraprenyl-beta-curcumene cyclase
MDGFVEAREQTRRHLLSLRGENACWVGQLSASALSTATAVVALALVDAAEHAALLQRGVHWLIKHQNADGGWGDTTISKSNLSTTLLVWSALNVARRHGVEVDRHTDERCETWISTQVGSLEPERIAAAVVSRYGKDKTFSVPILMLCAIGDRLGEHAWRKVLPLPFELAALPREWFGAIGLPVVSYALPALIAIGYARFHHAPPAWWNPLGWLRRLVWPRVRPMLKALQPSTGGYLEATPLTSFVTMALASADQKSHPCVAEAIRFLRASMRDDGAWPIDTNLATWGTTSAVKALADEVPDAQRIEQWLLRQQYRTVHPFTNAAPGGWAWTDLPGGVPDADDTSGALIALQHLGCTDLAAVEAGCVWLLDLQNRDGGVPTFCRGWGALPFDRSTPEITAHALWAWSLWKHQVSAAVRVRILRAEAAALAYLKKVRHGGDWCWEPLWFGNEHAKDEVNLEYGTAQVLKALSKAGVQNEITEGAAQWLANRQHADGSWGARSSIEETAVAVSALAISHPEAARRGAEWLIATTRAGTFFPASPIGLYFARLWYHEQLYPVVWTLEALQSLRRH